MTLQLVYMTASNKTEAESIARALVEDNLAACVNILPGVTSVYRWDGKIETAEECVLIAKTTQGGFERIAARVKELHSYKTPAIVGINGAEAEDAYAAWVYNTVTGG